MPYSYFPLLLPPIIYKKHPSSRVFFIFIFFCLSLPERLFLPQKLIGNDPANFTVVNQFMNLVKSCPTNIVRLPGAAHVMLMGNIYFRLQFLS